MVACVVAVSSFAIASAWFLYQAYRK